MDNVPFISKAPEGSNSALGCVARPDDNGADGTLQLRRLPHIVERESCRPASGVFFIDHRNALHVGLKNEREFDLRNAEHRK